MRLELLAEEIDVICPKLRVGTGKAQPLAPGLRDQHPVEWIGVVQRQRRRGFRMGPRDWQGPTARIDRDLKQIVRHVELADGALDPDLPDTRRRQVNFTFGNRLRLCGREARIVQDRPEQHMGVEQNPHLTPHALLEHLGDFGVTFKHVIRQRELALQGADQGPSDGTIRSNDPRDGTPVTGQLNGLPRLCATDQLGKLGLGFCDGDLHGRFPFPSDQHIGHHHE